MRETGMTQTGTRGLLSCKPTASAGNSKARMWREMRGLFVFHVYSHPLCLPLSKGRLQVRLLPLVYR